MFGYVTVCEPELKVKDLKKYRAYYCGLCRTLKEDYGFMGQMTLTYDMTFVILLLSGLYEPPTRKGTTRCIIHPVRKQPVRKNAITEYPTPNSTQDLSPLPRRSSLPAPTFCPP